jgi:hypothetical protein
MKRANGLAAGAELASGERPEAIGRASAKPRVVEHPRVRCRPYSR